MNAEKIRDAEKIRCEILSKFSEQGTPLSLVRKKRAMFEGKTKDGKSIIAVILRSTIHLTPSRRRPNGWFTVTKKQIDLCNEYKIKRFFFIFKFKFLNPYKDEIFPPYVNIDFDTLISLLKDSMQNNKNAGDHWKLFIYTDKIKIGKGRSLKISLQNKKITFPSSDS